MSWAEIKKAVNDDIDIPLNKAIGEIYDGNDRLHPEYNIEKKKSIIASPFFSSGSSAVVYNNKIHLLGSQVSGNYLKHYAWDGIQWQNVSTLPYNFYYGSAVVYNGEIHILGSSGASNKHYAWDGTQWRNVSTIPYNYYKGSAVVYNNKIHLLGSQVSGNYLKHYAWDGIQWQNVSTLPYNFEDTHNSAVVYNNEIHILGSSSQQTNHYVWDGTQWQSSTSLPYGFYRAPAVVYDNKIYCIGGGVYSGLQVYNGTSWTAYDASTTGVSFGYFTCAVVYNDLIYVIGSEANNSNRIVVSDNPSTAWADYILVDAIGNLFLRDTQNNKKMAYDKGRIKSVQRGVSASTTVTINYVDPSKCIVIIDPVTSGSTAMVVNHTLSENTLTLSVTPSSVVGWQVIEFN